MVSFHSKNFLNRTFLQDQKIIEQWCGNNTITKKLISYIFTQFCINWLPCISFSKNNSISLPTTTKSNKCLPYPSSLCTPNFKPWKITFYCSIKNQNLYLWNCSTKSISSPFDALKLDILPEYNIYSLYLFFSFYFFFLILFFI